MEETHSFKYSAFISYRHEAHDRKWAEWLVDALETYRVPKELQNAGYPARLGKVFRDRDELPSSGSLNNQIEEALKVSRFLIVICSPATPESRWVSREIEIFKELGRGDKIFPILIEGEPGESFPKVLTTHQLIGFDEAEANPPKQDHEPIGADVRPSTGKTEKETKKDELLRIVASLLGCAFDDLKQRDRQRELRKRRNRNFGIAAMLMLAIAGGVYWWDYTRIKTSYFNAYSTVYGVPVGVGEISLGDAQKRYRSYALSYQKRRLIRMVRQTGAQKANALKENYDVDPWLVGVAEWEYQYNDNGQLNQVVLKNDKGRERLIQNYEFNNNLDAATVAFKSKDSQGNLGTTIATTSSDLFGTTSSNKAEISQHRILFDANGHITSRNFQTHWGQPARDQQGSSGRIYRYDKNGLVSEIGFLDAQEQPQSMTLKNGIHTVQRKVNLQGLRIGWILLDRDRKPILGDSGYSRAEIALDELSRFKEVAFYSVDERPTLHKDGYTKLTLEFDNRGNVTEKAFYGIDGRPTLHKDGIAKLNQEFDARGNVTEGSYYGIDGQPTLHKGGYAKSTLEFDVRGNLTEQAYYGIDGQPTLHKNGYAKLINVFDVRGNLTEQAYYGIDGQPTLYKDGYAKLTNDYDERGNITVQNYYGLDGLPTLHKDGYTKFMNDYDARGNFTAQAYFGIDGQPALHMEGFAKVTQVFDTQGNLIEQSFYGIDGKLSSHKIGYAKMKVENNARGYSVREKTFDEFHRPTTGGSGYFESKATRDGVGNLLEERYFDVIGQAVLRKNILLPREELKSIFGTWRNLVLRGIHKQLTLESLDQGGFAAIKQRFSISGQVVSQVFFDVNGEPVAGFDGFSEVNSNHNAYGLPDLITAKLPGGNGIFRLRIIYNPRRNVERVSFINPDNSLQTSRLGFSEIVFLYDNATNKKTSVQYLDTDGKVLSETKN